MHARMDETSISAVSKSPQSRRTALPPATAGESPEVLTGSGDRPKPNPAPSTHADASASMYLMPCCVCGGEMGGLLACTTFRLKHLPLTPPSTYTNARTFPSAYTICLLHHLFFECTHYSLSHQKVEPEKAHAIRRKGARNSQKRRTQAPLAPERKPKKARTRIDARHSQNRRTQAPLRRPSHATRTSHASPPTKEPPPPAAM